MKKVLFILSIVALIATSCSKDVEVLQPEIAGKKKNNNGNGNGNGQNQQSVTLLGDTVFADFSGVLHVGGIPYSYVRLSWVINDARAIDSLIISKEVGSNGIYTDVFVQTPGVAIDFWDDPVVNASHYRLRGVFADGDVIIGNPDPLIGILPPQ